VPSQVTKTCPVCKRTFFMAVKSARRGSRFCSRKCYHARPQPLKERLWKKVTKGPGCWPWTGKLHKDGYGVIKGGAGRPDTVLTHRAAWELTRGPIPEGLDVLHRCDRPNCCRPAHLFLGTRADNNADKVSKGRQARGEGSSSAKLTEEQVREILRAHAAGEATQAELGRRFGVSPEAINGIVRGRHWKHLERPRSRR
jgi:hypothetical protein